MERAELPELSPGEWILMNVCWNTGKATARQVFESVGDRKTWEYQTVKTMLDRMAGKGYLRLEKLGPLCRYEPIVKQPKAVSRAIDRFLETVMDDSLGSLVVHLARKKKLSAAELEELRELFKEEES